MVPEKYKAVPGQFLAVPNWYDLVQTGTYCSVLISLILNRAFLLDSLLQCCPAGSSDECKHKNVLINTRTSLSFWRQRRRRRGGRHRRGRRLLFMLSFSSGAGAVGAVGRVCCLGLELAGQVLGLELAGQVLGHWTTSKLAPTPAFLRMLVESGGRVAEFCAKSVRVHGINIYLEKIGLSITLCSARIC